MQLGDMQHFNTTPLAKCNLEKCPVRICEIYEISVKCIYNVLTRIVLN